MVSKSPQKQRRVLRRFTQFQLNNNALAALKVVVIIIIIIMGGGDDLKKYHHHHRGGETTRKRFAFYFVWFLALSVWTRWQISNRFMTKMTMHEDESNTFQNNNKIVLSHERCDDFDLDEDFFVFDVFPDENARAKEATEVPNAETRCARASAPRTACANTGTACARTGGKAKRATYRCARKRMG